MRNNIQSKVKKIVIHTAKIHMENIGSEIPNFCHPNVKSESIHRISQAERYLYFTCFLFSVF